MMIGYFLHIREISEREREKFHDSLITLLLLLHLLLLFPRLPPKLVEQNAINSGAQIGKTQWEKCKY